LHQAIQLVNEQARNAQLLSALLKQLAEQKQDAAGDEAGLPLGQASTFGTFQPYLSDHLND
jgi:hypothetical protein